MGRNKDPVWKHYHGPTEQPGNKSVYCDYCNKCFKFSNVNKMKDHLKKCKTCPDTIKKQFCIQTSNEDDDQSRTENVDNDL